MTDREIMQQALDALTRIWEDGLENYPVWAHEAAIDNLRDRLAQPERQKTMPITDDHGNAIQCQRRVIEQRGKWFLLYDQHQVGNTVIHESRIRKVEHDIALYPGITLAEAQKLFLEKVESDHE